MRLGLIISMLCLVALPVSAKQTLVCDFKQTCSENGQCAATDRAIAVELSPMLNARDRAVLSFGDGQIGKTTVAYDRSVGVLSWQGSKFINAMSFTPASARVAWTMIPVTGGMAQVLFGFCREAF